MNKYEPRYNRRDHHIDEDNVVAEILEDIECLDLEPSELDNTDLLNDDTFGDFGDSHWDPTETFMEAERLKDVKPTKPRRTTTDLEKFNDFDIFLRKKPEFKPFRKEQPQRRKEVQPKATPAAEVESEEEERTWEKDLQKLRDFGLFDLKFEFLEEGGMENQKSLESFKVSQRTIERHVKCVERNEKTYEREFFINSSEFDKILRIQLAQVSKDPKLQSYSGKWNLYHLGVKNPRELEMSDTNEEKSDQEGTKKPSNRPNKFGRMSAASIRHGRRLIYLGGEGTGEVETERGLDPEVNIEKLLRTTIENCYETLYILCDVEQEIEKCPMNHVSALDKMQRDRDEYLQELFTLLTGDEELFIGILGLNKGRVLTVKIGRKFGIEQKLLLLSKVVSCLERFVEICKDVDVALEKEADLGSFIELASNPHNLKSLVAFEGSGSDKTNTSEGSRLQELLYNHSSYTRLFLFVVEGLTLTGHLFLLKGKDRRQTALQTVSNILIGAQQKYKGFEKILNTRSGVVFTNIFLQRIRTNQGSVDQNTIDVLLHYTLEVSERIEANQADWNALASNIVKMF